MVYPVAASLSAVGRLMLALSVMLCAAGAAQDPVTPPPALSFVVPAYPDSAKGLKQLMQDMLKAAAAPDPSPFAHYSHAIGASVPDTWFTETFGSKRGRWILNDYKKIRPALPNSLYSALRSFVQENLKGIEVLRFSQSCDASATEKQYPVLAARKQPVPLYEVRFLRGDAGKTMWFFAYVNGTFRYVGNLKIPDLLEFPESAFPGFSDEDDSESGKTHIVRREFQQAKKIKDVSPEYPGRALRSRMQGTVRLIALIDRDGSIKGLTVLQGHCWLAESAVNAVSRWRYSPTILNGRPFSVYTTIDVNFTLSP